MATNILLAEDEAVLGKLVKEAMENKGFAVQWAKNGSDALQAYKKEQPDICILDVMMPDMDGFEVTRRLRKNPATSAIPILMFTAKTQLDDKVAGFEVGADDYLTKPTHPNELQAHVKALLARKTPNKTGEITVTPNEKRGYVIGVLSARGGLGVSSVASNVASGLHTRAQADVVLAEMTPGQGTLGMDLGIANTKGLSEILAGTVAEVTLEKVQSSLITHNAGLKILPASDNPRDVDLASRVENFEVLVNRLASLARFIVLDLGSGLPAFVQKLLPLCNDRVVVLEGMPNSINHTKLLLSEMTELQLDPKTISVVLNNRQRSDAQIPWAQVQEKLRHPISVALTPAPEFFLQASRLQTPAIVAQPASMTSQQFMKFVDVILEHEKAQ
ncbi:MAG: response regulator [Anaerolineae bacterium]|nr:response regulator [Anaerolineae bacterium]